MKFGRFFLADSFYIYFTLMQSCTCCRNMQSLLASRPLTLSFYLHTCRTIYILYFEHYGNSFVDIYVNWVQVLNLFRYPFCVIIEFFFSLNSQSTPETKPLYCELGLKFQGIWQHQWAIMSLSQKAKSLKTVDSQMVWNI